MDWSSSLSALVGVLAGGGLTWLLTRQQWKRDQRTRVMERFFDLASRYVGAFDPSTGDRPRPTVFLPEVATAQRIMAIYVPRDVLIASQRLLTRLWADGDDDYPLDAWTADDSMKAYPDYVNALLAFEIEMRKALGLGRRSAWPSDDEVRKIGSGFE